MTVMRTNGGIKNNSTNKPKAISYLDVGDEVWLLHSNGKVLDKGVIEREVNNYVVFKGRKYWKRGLDGKHRFVNDYCRFLMTPEDGAKYAVE